nr:ZIM-domain protein 3 [Tanacetum cinerariifolium]
TNDHALLKSSAYQWSLSNGQDSVNNHHAAENRDSPRGPVQLTIFYRGMVNVYNDMSPEKVQSHKSLPFMFVVLKS